MDKSPDAFRTISEVAEELDVPQHVLRFWETRFSQIRPMKRGGGRRYYRPDDVELLRGIRHLLYGEGYTIRGVQGQIKEKGLKFVQSAWKRGSGAPAPAAPPVEADDRVSDDDKAMELDAAAEAEDDREVETAAPPHTAQRSRATPTLQPAAPSVAQPPTPPRAEPEAAPSVREVRTGGLSPDDLRQLHAALGELDECRRVLDAVLKTDD